MTYGCKNQPRIAGDISAGRLLSLQKCRPGTTHQIRGDVAIVPDEDFAQ